MGPTDSFPTDVEKPREEVGLRVLDEEVRDNDSDDPSAKHYATAYDVRDMDALGLAPIFRRRFKFIAMVGFSSTVTVAWENLLAVFSFALYNGGTGGLFWILIFSIVAMTFLYLTLAELTSCFPTAGGQYQWVAECAPPSMRRIFSYCTGWLCTIAWVTFLSSCGVIIGLTIKDCCLLYYPDSTSINSQWFPTIIAMGSLVLAGLFNSHQNKRLPVLQKIMLFVHFTSWIAIVVTLWVTSPHGKASEVLFTFNNGGGWSSPGVATLIGLLTTYPSLIGYDSAVHMTENAQDASKVVPWSLMTAFALNAIMALVMAVTMIFCLGNLSEVLSNANQAPFVTIFWNSTGSKASAVGMIVPIILCFMSAAFSEVATSSRQLWSFARDGGLPFSAQLEPVHDAEVPRRAVWTVVGLACMFACINFGSAVGFNALVSLVTVSLTSSYAITTFCVLWRRFRGKPLPRERFTLGAFGVYINVAALACIAPLTVLIVFPPDANPTPATMNWGSLVFGVIVILAAIYYLAVGRKRFDPVIRKEAM